MSNVQEPILDVAHLGHVELLTPKPEESLWFFRDVLSMQEVAREGQSVYLRCWGTMNATPSSSQRPNRPVWVTRPSVP